MNELFESLDLNDEVKTQLSEAFDKAVMVKSVELMDEHVQTKIDEARVELEEEYKEKVTDLEDTLDGYLQSVVEEFVAQNEETYEAKIQDAKATKLLEMFDKMVELTGVEMLKIQEAKEIQEDEASLENKIAKLEKRMSEKEEELMEARKEAEEYLKSGIILEMSEDLSVVEKDKFEKLAEMVTFSKDSKYIEALETIKESIISYRKEDDNKEKMDESTLPEAAFKPKEVDVDKAVDFSAYI